MEIRKINLLLLVVAACAVMPVFSPACSGGTSGGGGGGGHANPDPQYVDVNSTSPFSYSWVELYNASDSWMNAAAERIRQCNVGLYKATEGHMRLGSQNLYRNRGDGNIIIENLDSWNISGGGCGTCYTRTTTRGRTVTKEYYIVLCGNFMPDIFLHEFCHGQFEKGGDEYLCTSCVMGTYMIGRMQELMRYCDAGNCLVTGIYSRCWENWILQKYSGWGHTGADPGTPSACEVIIHY